MGKEKRPAKRARSARCLVAGSAMVDIIATIADQDVERMTLHNATLSFLLVEQGRKIEAESITTSIGGGGINVAVSMRRLGAAVDALLKVGGDVDADRVQAHLEASGIGTGHVRIAKNLPTGSAVLIASHDKDAAIYTQRGANTALTVKDCDAVDFTPYGLVYLAPLSGASAGCLKGLVAQAAAVGAFVAINPGIRQITTRSPDLLHALGDIDLLTLNSKEAAALAPALIAFADEAAGAGAQVGRSAGGKADQGARRLLADGLRLNDVSFSLPWFFATLAKLGAKRIAVTNGHDGSYLFSGAMIWHAPIREVPVMGTAGAGDAFASTLAYGLWSGLAEDTALIRAVVNASSVVGHADTQTGLLDDKTLSREAARSGIEVWRTGL